MNNKIFWYSTPMNRIMIDELLNKVETLVSAGYQIACSENKIKEWAGKRFMLDDRRENVNGILKGSITLYVNENGEELKRYFAIEGDSQSRINLAKLNAGGILKDTFKALEGHRMRDVFGITYSDDFAKCVPKPLYFIQNGMEFLNIENVNCADVSAMYPASGCGDLPTTKGAKTIEGYEKPSKDYPFAFYIKSGHCAEFGRFDTHDYFKLPARLKIRLTKTPDFKDVYLNVPKNEEVTILMKKSSRTMDSVFNYFWQKRNTVTDETEKQICKYVMNAGIGMLHRNPKNLLNAQKYKNIPGYYHLAAIIKARANETMLEAYKELTNRGDLILQMIVDSIIYKSVSGVEFGQKQKEMGKFHIEVTKGIYRSNGNINQYAIANENGEIIKFRCSGVKDPIIETLEDIDKYNIKEY